MWDLGMGVRATERQDCAARCILRGCSGNPEHLERVLQGGGTEKSKASDVRPGEGVAQRGLAVQEMRSCTLAPGDCRSSQIPTLSRAPTGGPVCVDRGRKGRLADSGVGGGCTHLGVASLGGAGSGGARVRPAHPLAAGSTVPGARLARAPPAVPPVAQSARARLTPSGTSSAPPGSTVPEGRAWGALPRAVRPSTPALPPALGALRPSREKSQCSAPWLARGRESPTLQSHPRAGPPSQDPQQKTDWSSRPGSPTPSPARTDPRLGLPKSPGRRGGGRTDPPRWPAPSCTRRHFGTFAQLEHTLVLQASPVSFGDPGAWSRGASISPSGICKVTRSWVHRAGPPHLTSGSTLRRIFSI